jgi:protein TonB
LGVVVALHAGVLLLLLAVKSATPLLLETPLMVQFIEPPLPLPPLVNEEAPKALPIAAPEPPLAVPLPIVPPKKTVAPKRPLPTPPKKVDPPTPPPSMSALEITASEEPASDSAPVTAASEPTASEPTPSRDTGASAGNDDSADVTVGARFDADYLKNPKPPYPSYSQRLGEEGKVILRVLVSTEGNAQEVELHTSSGSRRLDDSALNTVRAWKFVPAKRAGVAIESRVLVPILFKLEQ